MEKVKANLLFLSAVLGAVLLSPAFAQAASLYFSPSSGVYDTGKAFSVGVYVSSADQAMNAASGVVSFPADKVEITSLSKTGSIFNLWVQEPSFSNTAGTVSFEGIVLNPGFTGASGKIITLNFRAKTAGSANLAFGTGSVLANDGRGTDILSQLGTANFSVGGALPTAPETVTPPEAVSTGAPSAPVISSPTHPDPDYWYSNPKPLLSWDVPAGVNAVRLLVGKAPRATPTVVYSPPVSSKQLEELEDGTWYFHAQFRNTYGWGSIANYRLWIDTRPPEPFKITFPEGREIDNPRPTVVFETTDTLSGISHYRVKIGEGDAFGLAAEVPRDPHTLPLQAPGKRTILVQAFDRAGNYAVATEEFVIKPLESPTITEYPPELVEGETLVIKGKTYPDSSVRITLQLGGDGRAGYQDVKSDAQGNFTLIWEKKLSDGVYKFQAEVTDSRGAKSYLTKDFVLSVRPERWLQIGYATLNYLVILVVLVVVAASSLLGLWYLWRQLKRFRRKLRKEVGEVEDIVHKAFDSLRDNVREEIRILEEVRGKRQLTQEEERIIKQLKKTLDGTEKLLREEIGEMEKEIGKG